MLNFEGARSEKGLDYAYFPTLLSEITYTHPFYPTLIPNTPHVISKNYLN